MQSGSSVCKAESKQKLEVFFMLLYIYNLVERRSLTYQKLSKSNSCSEGLSVPKDTVLISNTLQ